MPWEMEGALVGGNAVRILIVDGDAEARDTLAVLLRRPGRTVQCFENLPEAVRSILHEEAHVLVLDCGQSGLPCETALSLLRELAPGLPVLLTTTDPEGYEAARWTRAGVFRVVGKPFHPAELHEAVDRARTFWAAGPPPTATPTSQPAL